MTIQDFLHQDFLGNSWERWAIAIAIFAGVLALCVIVRAFVKARLVKFAATTESNLDDLVVSLLENTQFYFFFFVALHLATHSLALHPKLEHSTEVIFYFILFLQIGMWINNAISFLGEDYVNRTLTVDAGKATTVRAMLFFGRILAWMLVVLLLLDNWGVKIAPFVAGLGIGGIAIALAVQSILGDLFASLSIVLDKPFVIGDSIGIDTEGGTVEYIGLKTTRLRRTSGEQLIVSNSDLLKSRIRNFKRMNERRVQLNIGVPYQTDVAKLEAVPKWLRQCVEDAGNTRFGRSHLATFGDSAIGLEMEYWVLSPDYAVFMDTQQKVALALLRKFNSEGVEFAYPTKKVFVEQIKNEPNLERA